MKKALLLLVIGSWGMITNVYADKYKILFINTPSVQVDKKVLHVGDVFDEESDIQWESQKQAMKVQNLKTKQIRLFTCRQFSKSKSIKDFFLKQNQLSTRGGDLLDEKELKSSLTGYFYMLDNIDFSTILLVDEMSYFTVVVNGVESKLPEENGRILLKRDLLDSDIDICKVSIFYVDKSSNSRTLITDSMTIELLPMEIK